MQNNIKSLSWLIQVKLANIAILIICFFLSACADSKKCDLSLVRAAKINLALASLYQNSNNPDLAKEKLQKAHAISSNCNLSFN